MATIPTIALAELVTNTWLTDVADHINHLDALTYNGIALDTYAAAYEINAYVHLWEQQTINTPGGTFTSGAMRTRTLTNETDDTGICTLSSNQFTLDASDYLIVASAPAYAVNGHRTQLYNTTGAALLLHGGAGYADATNVAMTRSWLIGVFTIAASQALEFRHECATTKATDGFGLQTNLGVEVYSNVQLWRIGA